MASSRRHAVKMKQWPLKNLLSLLVLNEIFVSCVLRSFIIKIGLNRDSPPHPSHSRKQTSRSGSKVGRGASCEGVVHQSNTKPAVVFVLAFFMSH